MLAVSDDERKDLDKFLATKSYTFPILLDHERKTFDEFDVTGVPKTFIYDRAGHLVAQAIDNSELVVPVLQHDKIIGLKGLGDFGNRARSELTSARVGETPVKIDCSRRLEPDEIY